MRNSIIALLVFALLASFLGVFIMTDMGQIFGVAKQTVVWYFKNNSWIIGLSLIALLAAIFLNRKNQIFSQKVVWISAGLWVVFVLSTKFVTPYLMFGTTQEGAEFSDSSSLPNDYLDDEEVVFVIDRNGVQRAYPRSYIWQTHIVGADFGEENVVMTYCVMTNLPTPFLNDINGQEVNFKVLAQTNNNLLIWDRKSGEIIQQITQKCEFNGQNLDPLPVLEMSYGGFKKAYPEGTIFVNEWNTPMEKALNLVFDAEENINGEEFLFETANLEDTRFAPKEKIIGVADQETGKQLAISKDHIRKRGEVVVKVGQKDILLKYFPQYQCIASFYVPASADSEDLVTVNLNGKTEGGTQLERAFIYNSLFWGVWCYYYPETEVLI